MVVVRFVVGASADVVAVERAMMRECQEGGGPRVGSEARRGCCALVGAVRTGAVSRHWDGKVTRTRDAVELIRKL